MAQKSDYVMSIPVVSLSHLTPMDRKILAGDTESYYPWPRRASYPDGWFVWGLGSDLIEAQQHNDNYGYSDGFWECFRRHFENADWAETIAIRFDEDGDVLDGIPTHGD